ncbi:hypothetical protein I3842_01G263300 [Carya illinoinensis]|uniref:Transmembrane protein n=1 Tax=Carya illinoinensis TaxID=32201 RepID=A0A922KBG5_CARIL|nr:hypothetical protein I3842_01G263300 [Carya illinoinensis]
MKKGSVHLLLILCLTILLTFLMISLSLSLSVSKQHNPFLSTYESIVVKRSGRVTVFFMFNVIVITIFINGSCNKPSTEDFDWSLSFPHLVYEAEDTHYNEATWKAYDHVDSDPEDANGYHARTDDEGYNDEDIDDDGSNDDDDDLDSDEEEQDYKDLERRIEEFIAKIYKQRREELIYERLSFSSRPLIICAC